MRLINERFIQPGGVLTLAATLLLSTGCRNTTNSPISPLGNASTLTPVSPLQPSAQLSPIQPTSGVSALGSPTRVPPPPTGSGKIYQGGGLFNGLNTTPPSNYGPTGGLPSNQTSSLPNGAATSSIGLTRGVTDLGQGISQAGFNALPNHAGAIGSGVQPSGWIGESDAANPAAPPQFGSSFGNAPVNNSAPAGIRAGGMQVIDLTAAPYPPGYVPPQERGAYNLAPAPTGQLAPSGQASPSFSPAPVQQRPMGQGVNSTFPRIDPNPAQTPASSPVIASTPNGMQDSNFRGVNAFESLPSTEPLPSQAQTASGNNLQWRRPSPRF